MSVETPVQAPNVKSLTLDEVAQRALAGDRGDIAISWEGGDVSWGWVADVADAVTTALRSSGLEPGAPVALIARSQPEGCAAFAALLAERRTIFPVYSYQSPGSLATEIGKLDVGAVIADAEDWSDETIAAARARGMVALMLERGGAVTFAGGLDRVTGEHRGAYDEPSIELLTSGTTGVPKRHQVTYAQLKRCIVDSGHIQGMTYDPDAPPMTVNVPLGNISGIYGFLVALASRRRIELARKFTLAGWLDYIRRYQPVFSGLPPAGVKMMLDSDITRADLGAVKYITIGMGPVDPQIYRQFEERFGLKILTTYGATEFVGAAAATTPADLERWGDAKFGSVGRACDGVSLRVRDQYGDALLPIGEVGLLEVQIDNIGPHWMKTTDLARIDEDGFLYLLGRADGVINRGGFKIHPGSIETVLGAHPAVATASVVGIPDARLGEVPVAAVELRSGAAVPDEAELIAHARAGLPATNIPVAIRVVDELPRTPSLKVKLDAVRALFTNP